MSSGCVLILNNTPSDLTVGFWGGGTGHRPGGAETMTKKSIGNMNEVAIFMHKENVNF